MSDEPSDDGGGPDQVGTTASNSPPDTTLDRNAARERLIEGHGEALARTLDCAATVAAGFEGTVDGCPASENSRTVRHALRTVLDRAGLLDAFAELLPDLVRAAGGTMSAPPVAGPPYVTVTSTGPVLRATLTGGRLVVRIEAFEVVDGAFVWSDPSPRDAVHVEVRR